MKKIIVLVVICLSLGIVNAQENDDKKWSVGLHYPISVGDNFVKNVYNGVVGIDVNYKVTSASIVDIRLGLTTDYFNYNFIEELKGHALVFKPKVIGEFNIHNKIKPFVSIGYGFMSARTKIDVSGLEIIDPFDVGFSGVDETIKDDLDGFNFAVGLKYIITDKFFVQSSFDYLSFTEAGEGVPDISYNKNAHSIYFGVGMNF